MNIYNLVLYFDEGTCEIEAPHVTDDRLKIWDTLQYTREKKMHGAGNRSGEEGGKIVDMDARANLLTLYWISKYT